MSCGISEGFGWQAPSCIPAIPALGLCGTYSRAGLWWQREVGAAGTPEARPQPGQLLSVWSGSVAAVNSNDDSKASVLHNLEEILVDLKKLIVPRRARTRSGSAAVNHAWLGCSHPPLPQFPCFEKRLKGTFPSLAGTGKHELEMSPRWDRDRAGPILPGQPGARRMSMGGILCGCGALWNTALPGRGVEELTSPPATALPITWRN